ncbi:hypothetical protein, conserved [Angomonas deanei]|uniref:Uncharacterized protein n=1 Tax=Angomonas deanei TaxID=59799 RepID=A0A7G2CBZ3_9TRYP|nr:hypothetical protein, conserved [Angomonas deanei]
MSSLMRTGVVLCLLFFVCLSDATNSKNNQFSHKKICQKNCGPCYLYDHYDIPEEPLQNYNKGFNAYTDITFLPNETSYSKYSLSEQYLIKMVSDTLARRVDQLYCQVPSIYYYNTPIEGKEMKYKTKTRPVYYTLESGYYFVTFDSPSEDVITATAVRGTFDLHCANDPDMRNILYKVQNVSSAEIKTTSFGTPFYYCLWVQHSVQAESCYYCTEKSTINTARLNVVAMAGRLAGEEIKEEKKKSALRQWPIEVVEALPGLLFEEHIEAFYNKVKSSYEKTIS